MNRTLNQLVETCLIKEFTKTVSNYLTEAGVKSSTNGVQVSQMFAPSLASSLTAAGNSLRPGSMPEVGDIKNQKQLFRIIKTTPLYMNLLAMGLISLDQPEQPAPEESPQPK